MHPAAAPLFVLGDVHGQRERLAALLREAGLIDRRDRWAGGDARLRLIGDLVDRGPDGVGAIELVAALERRGDVRCLLGNHEALLLAVRRHADEPLDPTGFTFRDLWRANGGEGSDLHRLEEEHVAWLVRRPAVLREDDWLLVHSDSEWPLAYGSTPAAVNAAVGRILAEGGPAELDALFGAMADRGGLADPEAVTRLLATLGGERVVHGHTPIAFAVRVPPEGVTGPLVSPDGRVVNVDHCLFAGGPGFVVRLDEL